MHLRSLWEYRTNQIVLDDLPRTLRSNAWKPWGKVLSSQQQWIADIPLLLTCCVLPFVNHFLSQDGTSCSFRSPRAYIANLLSPATDCQWCPIIARRELPYPLSCICEAFSKSSCYGASEVEGRCVSMTSHSIFCWKLDCLKYPMIIAYPHEWYSIILILIYLSYVFSTT